MHSETEDFLTLGHQPKQKNGIGQLKESQALTDYCYVRGGHMVRIGLATSERDKLAIYRLRYEIFCKEIGKTIPGTDNSRKVIIQPGDTLASLICIKDEHQYIGTLRLLTLQNYNFQDFYGVDVSEFLKKYEPTEISNSSLFCIRREYRGHRIPQLFAPFLFGLALRSGTRINVCIAPPRCLDFYRKFGYRPFGHKLYREEYGEDVLPFYCDFSDRQFLARIRSPFLEREKQSLDIKPHSSTATDSRYYLFF